MEKDSPSSRTTKSSFFSRSAHLFGRRNKHIFRAYPSIRKIAELCFETTAAHSTICPKPSALSAFSLFEEQAQALLSYCHFHSFLILHYIYYISQRSNAKNCFRITGLQRQDSKPSADNNTRYSPSKSVTECIKFTKRAELRTDF